MDSVFVSFPYQKLISTDIAGGQFHFVSDSIFKNKGFPMDDSDGLKPAWLVWLVSADSLDKINNESLSLLIYRNELTFEAGKSTYKIEAPSTGKWVVGGFYIVPQIEGIGNITLYLSGLVCGKDKNWQVVRLREPKKIDAIVPAKPKPTKDGLTPVKM
jgi:hypothetical protein